MLAVDASPIRIGSRTFLPVPENVDSILFDWLLHPDDGSVAGIHVNLTGVFEFRNIIDDLPVPTGVLPGNFPDKYSLALVAFVCNAAAPDLFQINGHQNTGKLSHCVCLGDKQVLIPSLDARVGIPVITKPAAESEHWQIPSSTVTSIQLSLAEAGDTPPTFLPLAIDAWPLRH